MKKVEMMIIIAEAMQDDLLGAKTSEFVRMYREEGFNVLDTYDNYTDEELDNYSFKDLLPSGDKIGFDYIYEQTLGERLKKNYEMNKSKEVK